MMHSYSSNQSPTAVAPARKTPRLYPIIRCELLKFFNRRKLEQCKLVSRRWDNTTGLHPSQFRARQRFDTLFIGQRHRHKVATDLPEFSGCCQNLEATFCDCDPPQTPFFIHPMI